MDSLDFVLMIKRSLIEYTPYNKKWPIIMKSTPYPDALTGRPKTPDPDFSINKKTIKLLNQINKLPFLVGAG